MSDPHESAPLAALDIFLPSPPADRDAQEAFLDEAAVLAEAGHPITVYLQDEDAWAFAQCEPVAELLASAGDAVLPVTLLGADIVVSSVYPTAAQMERFTRSGGAPRERPSAAAAACGPGGAPGGAAPMPREAGGFAAQLLGVAPARPRPEGGPDIGGRRNLMGGDVGDGLPER
ncbi:MULTISPECIES: arsenic metallochaperone ArsD family protein [Brachybacterium]|uniref:Arsenical resistance operon transcriptional repressor ArsD n=1 Tax=Brachybacterium saurashtrense TaxID=556288 RepID=A0A345YKG7_9MICO|nr:arsenic metallochaperone ArsD family protein [Brachybacterium saurashtrense]AXK44419.1 arsenical resistance operon transcriptional repressor ArsD [Brachybacterium saurashtrense]RRR23030.1 arsenical resistance operon transcriptional repressor ArsD [Brachybacterium saurashtrense]